MEKSLLKNYLLLIKINFSRSRKIFLAFFIVNMVDVHKAQVVNYVSNGSFEVTKSNSILTQFDVIENWEPINPAKNASFLVTKLYPYMSAPYSSYGFQYPRTGNNFILTQFYCESCVRWYPRNLLKQTLKPNTIYCAKYYIVNTNNNRVAIDSYGMYLGNSSLDTIIMCDIPLTYLTPQVENQNGIITDTLNWIPVTGTFVATGNEKYLVLGNFRSNAATNTLLINPFLSPMSNDVYIDDVSVIELNLPAFAGNDTSCIPGNTIYIGRERDVGIDEACTWYQLPDMVNAIDTAAGIWVSPVVTTTYVVRQEICGNVKWDTVVVYPNPVGIKDLGFKDKRIKVYPNPTDDLLSVKLEIANDISFNKIFIYNHLGQLLREEDVVFKEKEISVSTADLLPGIYQLKLCGNPDFSRASVIKKFVVAK